MQAAEQVGRARRTRSRARPADGEGGGTAACNEVRLVGRIAAPPVERELPSGDVLLAWRVIVDRPPPRRPAPAGVRQVTVDTLDCVAWSAAVRRSARSFAPGDVVQVEGALRRRFWRAGGAAASRTEVDVGFVRRLVRAADSA